MRARLSGSTGFSLVELQVVVALVAILAGMTGLSVQAALTTARGDTAMTQVTSLLRQGRDTAIAQRRTVDLQFEAPNRIRLVRNEIPLGTTTIGDVVLENRAQFQFVAALPDTPDGFGNAQPIDFGDADMLRFLPDGTFTDATGVPLNGSVFLGITGEPLASRAVTVTGGSARAQAYRWTGVQWEPR